MTNAYQSTSGHLAGFLSSIYLPGCWGEKIKHVNTGRQYSTVVKSTALTSHQNKAPALPLTVRPWASFLPSPKAQFPQLLNGG